MKWTKIGLYASIGIAAILVLGFLGETLGLFGGNSGTDKLDKNIKIYLLCVNPSCKAETEVTAAEYKKMVLDTDPNPAMMGPIAVNCPKCNKNSSYRAEKCEKCGVVFIPGQVEDDYSDRCPSCGDSKTENMSK